MEKYRVTLDPEERAALEQLVSRGKAASRKLTHARILLLADARAGRRPRRRGNRRSPGYQPEDHRSRPEAIRHRRDWRRPSITGRNRHGRTRSRSRETSNRSWSNWPAPTRPVGAATGPCNCWPTRWSSWVWSIRSAPRRCGRR